MNITSNYLFAVVWLNVRGRSHLSLASWGLPVCSDFIVTLLMYSMLVLSVQGNKLTYLLTYYFLLLHLLRFGFVAVDVHENTQNIRFTKPRNTREFHSRKGGITRLRLPRTARATRPCNTVNFLVAVDLPCYTAVSRLSEPSFKPWAVL